MTQTQGYDMPAPSAENIAKVMALVQQLRVAQLEQAKAEAEAAEKKAAVTKIAREEIPELMLQMGLRELPLANGAKLVVDDKISASIPKDRILEAITWLEQHGEGGMVKRVVTVAFNRDQEEAAKALVGELQKKFAGTNVDAWVEPQTLKAYAKRQVTAGEEFPKDLFGVFRFDEASVKEPRGKKSVFGE